MLPGIGSNVPQWFNRPLTHITPLSLSDGATYERKLDWVYRYIVDWLTPQVDVKLDEWFAQYKRDNAALLKDISNEKSKWEQLFNSFMADVVAQLEALNDQAVANLIKDLQSKTRKEINVLLKGFTDAVNLSTLAISDQVSSNSKMNVDYLEDANIVQNWSNLSGWTTANLDVVNGFVSVSSGFDKAGAKKYLSGISGEARVVGKIQVVNPGVGTGITMIGVNNSPNDNSAETIGYEHFFGIGVNADAVPFGYAGTIRELSNAKPIPPGVYTVTGSLTSVELSFTLASDDGTVYYTFGRAREEISPSITHVAAWNSDSRGRDGNKFGGLGVRYPGLGSTLNPRANIDNGANWRRYAIPPRHTHFSVIATPKNYDSRVPVPVIIYAHGSGDRDTDFAHMNRPNAIGKVSKALIDAGYMIVSGAFGGTQNWGYPGSTDDMRELYAHLKSEYNVGSIFLMGHSMGGLITLQTIVKKTIPNVAGFIGIEPVVSLRAAFDRGYTNYIKTAFEIAGDGSDYDAKTRGYDPALYPGAAYRGLPMWLSASNGDTNVLKSENTDVLRGLVSGLSDVTFYEATGGHVDESHFQGESIVRFCNKVLAR